MDLIREYLAGRIELLEYNHLSPGSLSDLVNVNRTTRQDRLAQAWGDFLIQLEALWSDVLNIEPDLYELADSSLKEIRNTPPSGCINAVSPIQNLVKILERFLDGRHDEEIELFQARMVMVARELEYICDTFDPNKPHLPGSPTLTKREWDRKQQKADLGKPGDGEADVMYAVDQGIESDDEDDEESDEFDDEESEDDNEEGIDFEGGNEEEPPRDGDEDEPESERNPSQLGTEPDSGEEGGDGEGGGGEDSEDGEQDEDPERLGGKTPTFPPKKRKNGIKEASAVAVMNAVLDGAEPNELGQEFDISPEQADKIWNIAGGLMNKKAMTNKPQTLVDIKKILNERHLPPRTPSLVLASFSMANDAIFESNRDQEAEVLEASRSLAHAMEEFSDVSSALTEVGSVFPGNPPRIDLFVEWQVTEKGLPPSQYWKTTAGENRKKGDTPWGVKVSGDGSKVAKQAAKLRELAAEKKRLKRKKRSMKESRPSDCYGYARLQMTESGLEIRDFNDVLRDTIKVTEDIRDQEVVDRVYENLSIIYDLSNRRTLGENSVVSAIYRLIERGVSEESFAQVISSLRTRIGIHENVRMVSTEIGLKLDEDFHDTYNYFFAWSVQQPMTHLTLPDELGVDTTDEPVPDDTEFEIFDEEGYISSAPKSKNPEIGDDNDGEDGKSDLGIRAESRKQGQYTEYWRTPSLAVSLREKKVYFVHEGEKEELDKETTDEDIAARLASMAYQKENITTGYVIEGNRIQVNRRDNLLIKENVIGTFLDFSLEDLEQMSTDDLWQIATERGIKVKGDGTTWNRKKLLTALSGLTEAEDTIVTKDLKPGTDFEYEGKWYTSKKVQVKGENVVIDTEERKTFTIPSSEEIDVDLGFQATFAELRFPHEFDFDSDLSRLKDEMHEWWKRWDRKGYRDHTWRITGGGFEEGVWVPLDKAPQDDLSRVLKKYGVTMKVKR